MPLFVAGWKIAAQNLVYNFNQPRLVVSEAQLNSAIRMYVNGNKKVISDCVRLINSTVVPAVFFSRIDTLFEVAERLVKLERIRPELFTQSPGHQIENIRAHLDGTIDAFIMRYWTKANDMAIKKKSVEARKQKYDDFFAILDGYASRMRPKNRETIASLKQRAYNALQTTP